MVLFSFHKTGGLSFPFTGFSLRWYREVFASESFRSALQNSAIVASCVAAVTLVLGTAAAYGLTKMREAARADGVPLLSPDHAARALSRDLDARLLRAHRLCSSR